VGHPPIVFFSGQAGSFLETWFPRQGRGVYRGWAKAPQQEERLFFPEFERLMGPIADLFPTDLPSGTVHLKSILVAGVQVRLAKATQKVAKTAEFSHARTKSGGVYSAEMTNCGAYGWWSDAEGYRYTEIDPRSGAPWPQMPKSFTEALKVALSGTTVADFKPDACLINHYVAGTKMGLHQDKDEADFARPIVTVSLGAAADFLIGGFDRSDKPTSVLVESGDVFIMGGESRMRFHGIRKIYSGSSPLPCLEGRLSLTFRKAT
jgi:DNA oxidative demethylase